MGRQEIVRTVCVVATFLNIICAAYFVVVHRPAMNVEHLKQQAAIQRMGRMAAPHHGFSDIVRFAKSDSDVPPPAGGRHDGDAVAVAQEYMDAHGIAAEWVRLPTSHAQGQIQLVWWAMQAAMQALSDGGDSAGEDPALLLAVPFAGTGYMPWLDVSWMAAVTPRPKHIPRTYDAQRRFLTVPAEAIVAFSMNGTVPLHYDTHHVVTSLQQSPLSKDDDDAWLADDGDDSVSVVAAEDDRPKRIVTRKDFVRILTTVLRMIETPNYDANIASARMQRALVLRVQQLAPESIAGKDVLVFGSLTEPFLEVTMLGIGGARRVISVDHVVHFQSADKRIVSFSERVFWQCIKSRERCPSWLPETFRMPKSFPVIVAYNTVQHDGLGRYGDALDPLGDVKLMWELRSLLSMDPKAILLLGVPLGNDCVVFNRHRVYGRRRLPLLLLGYRVSGTSGFEEAVDGHSTFGASWPTDPRCLGNAQRIPLLVLKKNVLVRGGVGPSLNESLARFVPPAYVASWFHVPGLVGPYPLYG